MTGYIQSDPLGLAGGDLSTYVYAHSQPTRYIDPTGLFFTSVDMACLQNPEFCMDVFGTIITNAAALSGDQCLLEEATVFADRLRLAGTVFGVVAVSKATAQVASAANYRDLFTKARPDLPSGWSVHHSIPQRYGELMRTAGVNVHDVQFLRGVSPQLHAKITKEWQRFHRAAGGNPTAAQVAEFAKQIDKRYGGSLVWPGF